MEIDEPADDAMVSDLAPILAALRHSALRPAVARSLVDSPVCSQLRFVFKMRVLKVDRR